VILFVLALTSLTGCGEKKRKAHLDKFQDNQKGAPVVALPAPLEPSRMATQAEMADRIHLLTFTEAVLRIGPHQFHAKTHYEFDSGSNKIELGEEDWIVQARNGDFKVAVENNADQGYELLYSQGNFYSRNRFDPFHQRQVTLDEHIRWRDAAYGAWASIYRLYRGSIDSTMAGTERIQGRSALRFQLKVEPGQTRLKPVAGPGKIPKGVTKYIYSNQLPPSDQQKWRERVEPEEGRGTLWVDKATGVPLKGEFSGKLSFTRAKGSGAPTVLTIATQFQSDSFGGPDAIPAPPAAEVKPVPERIPVDTHPLDFFFGKGFTATLGKPAGVAAAKAPKTGPEPGGPPSKPKP